MTSLIAPLGILLPGGLLNSHLFGVLTAFVAVNTVMYVGLAVAKAMPKVYVRDLLPRGYRRAETRSIHPDGPR